MDKGCRGALKSATNAAGQITQITKYDAHGHPLTLIDANGLSTTFRYAPRGWLTSRNVGGQDTIYRYDAAGQLVQLSTPEGSVLNYRYDGAHRLTEVRDGLGNKIVYTLDAMGNRTQEQVFDPSGTLSRTRQREYDALNRLKKDTGGAGQITQYGYDANGNLTQQTDPLGRLTNQSYDGLDRLSQALQPTPASGAARPATGYRYDGQDRLAQVSDARNVTTRYSADGLGNTTQLASPDSGTSNATYDEAGNLKSRTDAKGQLTQYRYDALNRLVEVRFAGGARQAYTYDAGENAQGRLSAVAEYDAAGALQVKTDTTYDAWGRVTGQTRQLAGVTSSVQYHYDSAGRLYQLRYPSGRTVDYQYDLTGRVLRITTTGAGQGAAKTVAEGIAYAPFGDVARFTYGNGQVFSRGFDLDGRLSLYSLGARSYALGLDAASQIGFISDVGDPNWLAQYDYDGLGRLTGARPPGDAYTYSYDAVGNRLSRTSPSTTLTTYQAASNRLATINGAPLQFDANGSLLSGLGGVALTYDARGRLVQATTSAGTTTYLIDAQGRRLRKSGPSGETSYHYDLAGHLIAETGASGATTKEYLYLGDLPIAVVAQ